MKKMYLFCTLLLAAFTASAQCPVAVDGFISFTSQAQIDAFPTDYPTCTSLGVAPDPGDPLDLGVTVEITGLDIVNMAGLSGVTSYLGTLWILDTGLTDLSDLPVSATFGLLLINNNLSLASCDVSAVCLAMKAGFVLIYDNDPFGTCNADDTFASCDPLPVTLINFIARKELGTSVLTWSTTSETNSDRFEIQRSSKGRDWSVLGSVKAQGESNFTRQYSFIDGRPLNGTNLYRLKMIDLDGTFTYSKLRSLGVNGEMEAVVFPNPVTEVMSASVSGDAVSKLQLFDNSGKLVFHSTQRLITDVNLKHLPAGKYIVRITGANGSVYNKQIVKK